MVGPAFAAPSSWKAVITPRLPNPGVTVTSGEERLYPMGLSATPIGKSSSSTKSSPGLPGVPASSQVTLITPGSVKAQVVLEQVPGSGSVTTIEQLGSSLSVIVRVIGPLPAVPGLVRNVAALP